MAAASSSLVWATSASSAASASRAWAACARSSSGSRPEVVSCSSSWLSRRTRSAATEPVDSMRSRRLCRRTKRSWARVSSGAASAERRSTSESRWRTSARASSTAVRRSRRAVSSATSCSRMPVSCTRSSASRRSRASRASAWMTAARRAASACRPSGPSWRRISPVRSCTRVRLSSMVSSLRSARSLRRRCLSTPAASSMKPRRSSGVARSTVSSWPWPTMTCISRPRPESESSSCTSRSRQEVPLMAYSEPPPRNIVRVMVTSV